MSSFLLEQPDSPFREAYSGPCAFTEDSTSLDVHWNLLHHTQLSLNWRKAIWKLNFILEDNLHINILLICIHHFNYIKLNLSQYLCGFDKSQLMNKE